MEIAHTGYDVRDRVSRSEVFTSLSSFQGNRVGMELMELIPDQGTVAIGHLVGSLNERYDVPSDALELDVCRFLHEAQTSGYINFYSTWARNANMMMVRRVKDSQYLTFHNRNTKLTLCRRISLSPTYFNTAMLVARSMMINGLSISVLLGGLLLGLFTSAEMQITYLTLVSFCIGIISSTAVFVAAGVVHEAAHLGAARGCSSTPQFLYREGTSVVLNRLRTSPGQEIWIATIGPVAGAMVAWGLAALWIAMLPQAAPNLTETAIQSALILGLPLLPILTNIATLIPPSQDGRNVGAAIKEMVMSRKVSRA